MRGVVAAGNVATAQAGAEALRAGGNAVDAVVAASLAGLSAEPLLTSAGGAGIMLVRNPGEAAVAIDLFSGFPGAEARPPRLDFHAIEVDFGEARQVFHVGRGSAAVPLLLDGLAFAAERFGSLALARLAARGIELAREGIIADAITARTFELLWPILRRDPASLAELIEGAPTDRPPRAGERLRNSRLAATLEEFVEHGRMPPRLRAGLIREFGPARGGLISAADVDAAQVRIVEPHVFEVDGWRVLTSPRPGGHLVGVITRELMLGQRGLDEVEEVVRQARASLAGHQARRGLTGSRGSTTHISVVDERGGAAAITMTAGEGCGHVVEGTGVHINNFLGEEDLNPDGFHCHQPGDPLPTMIAPTIATHPDGRVVVLGSGGANRIRSAVALVLMKIAREGSPLAAAVGAPRVHAEDEGVWIELAGRTDPEATRAGLAAAFPAVHGFRSRAFFFGGVHVAALDGRGELAGAGDPRRGGVAEIV